MLLIVAALVSVTQADQQIVQPVTDSDYDSSKVKAQDNMNCTMRQFCLAHKQDGTCEKASETFNPELYSWAPTALPFSAQIQFMNICPYYKMGSPVCCTADQVDIMTANFMTIDQVFGRDVSMCGLNLKKLWCEYTCSPRQKDFVNGTGYKLVTLKGRQETNMTSVVFSVNEDFACTLFQSCKKVSMIASASIQSSLAFLDFLGNNGEATSLSIITFTFNPVNKTGGNPSIEVNLPSSIKESGKCGASNEGIVTGTQEMVHIAETSESESKGAPLRIGEDEHENDPWPLYVTSYPCDQPIPADGKIDGYKVEESHCTFCDALCSPPAVNGDIGFFNEFKWEIVAIVYGAIILVSIVVEVIRCFCCNAKINAKYEELVGDDNMANAEERANKIQRFDSQYK